MRFTTKLFFISFFFGLLTALSVLAEEPKLQVQFQDDRAIFHPEEGYRTSVEDVDIGLEEDHVCMVYNYDEPGVPEVDENGLGKVHVLHRAEGRIETMDIGEFFDFAVSICQKQLLQRKIEGRPGRVALSYFYASLHYHEKIRGLR